MAITTTGNISLKGTAGNANSIEYETEGALSGDASLATLSAASNEWTGSTRGAVATKDTNTAPYGMLEFSGYTHLPAEGVWPAGMPGEVGTEIQNWGTEARTNDSGIPGQVADAACDAQFHNDTANNRIRITMTSYTNLAMATTYTGYFYYGDLSNAASSFLTVRYNYSGSVTNLSNEWSAYAHPELNPGISKNTYITIPSAINNGVPLTQQFFWIAHRSTTSNTITARLSASSVYFEINVWANVGTQTYPAYIDYTVNSISKNIGLEAKLGQEL